MRRCFLMVFMVILSILFAGCGPNLEVMVRNLENPTPEVREQAIKDLIDVGAPCVDKVIPLLGSKNSHTRDAASDVLIEIGEPSIDSLIKVIDDTKTDSILAGQAVYILGELGEKHKAKTEEALVRHLDDSRYLVKVNSIVACGKIKSRKALGKLIELLEADFGIESPDWELTRVMFQSIGKIGHNDANDVIFKYIKSAKTPPKVKKDILTYIEGISTNDMRERLITYVKEMKWGSLEGMEQLSVIVKTLGNMPKSDELVQLLLKIQKYYGFDETFYPKIIYALDKIGQDDPDIQAMIDKLEEEREKKEKKGK